MGYGSYRASDWTKLKQSRGISSSSDAAQIFSSKSIQDKYNPRFINVRESCDSEDSPESTPIIIAFDVTGSMGYLAAEIAKNSLNKTITEIYDKKPVTNPHVMCAAITDPHRDTGLQVTQFEADIRVIEQLLDLRVGFGGNLYSYDSLIWYFAAKHTKIDSFDKRGKKGFLFFIGDEICGAEKGEWLLSKNLKDVFDDEVEKGYPLREIADMAMEKYEIFHIVTGGNGRGLESWQKFLPGRVAEVKSANIEYLSEVITSIMQLTNGMPAESVISQWSGKTKDVVAFALSTMSDSVKYVDDSNDGALVRLLKKLFK